MAPPQHWIRHKFFLSVFFLLIINILALDFLFGVNFLGRSENKISQVVAIPTPTPTFSFATTTSVEAQTCPPSCLSAINEAVVPLKFTPSPTPRPRSQQILQSTVTPAPQPTVFSQKAPSVKEFFIPLGSGSSTATDWTDVPGVKAEIDKTKYGTIQKVLFEASVHVADANEIVEVRLYNETDKYIVGNSEFLYPSGTTQNFRIAEIQLGQGAKVYKVQMKTQLQYTAVLDQARIHITTY